MRSGPIPDALADRLGVDQSFVSEYEAGHGRLDVIEFLTIIAAIGQGYRDILDDLARAAQSKLPNAASIGQRATEDQTETSKEPRGSI